MIDLIYNIKCLKKEDGEEENKKIPRARQIM